MDLNEKESQIVLNLKWFLVLSKLLQAGPITLVDHLLGIVRWKM